jgi:AraC-like DNA-binding protein
VRTLTPGASTHMNEAATNAWKGQISLLPEGGIFSGAGGTTCWHRHPAHKLAVGRVAVTFSQSVLTSPHGATLIPASITHRLCAPQAVNLVYLDARYFSLAVAQRLAARLRHAQTTPYLLDNVLEDIGRLQRSTVSDWILQTEAAFSAGEPLVEVASRCGLSPSRLTHVVTEALGAPLRTWRTWNRLLTAVASLHGGATVTDVSHQTGFSDSAHLSRQCKAMLGIAPGSLLHSDIRRTSSSVSAAAVVI